MLTQDVIDQARKVDLLALVGGTLRKAAGTGGGEYAGPCPLCGQGRDRFRVQPKGPDGGRWYCRTCGGDKWHDAIDLVQRRNGLNFAEAVAYLTGGAALASAPALPAAASSTAPEPHMAPSAAWQARGRAFVAECQTALWSEAGQTALEGLRARGLADATIKAAGLGYNPRARHDERAAWGLPDEVADNGKPKGVWLPRGVVIPWEIGGDLWRVNIRRPAEDLARDQARGLDPSKYIGPAGFGNGLYNADALRPGCVAVLVEGEIDALTIAQHAGGLAVAVATGSTHGARRTRWLARLALADLVLVAYDADPPGQAAGDYWLGVLSNARRWRPWWEDANQMARDGADLRQWVAIGLGLDLPGDMSQIRHEKRAPAGPDALAQPVPGESAQVKHEKSALAEPDQVAALEAELEALLDELGRARGSWADLAHDSHPAHEAYRHFCDLERQWLDLHNLDGRLAPAALVSPDQLARTQDEADQVTRRAQRDPQRARLDQLLQWPKEGGLTPAEVAEVRALAQACGVAVRLERLDLADLAAGWHEVTP